MEQYLKILIRFLSKDEGGRRIPLILNNNYCPHFRVIGDAEYLGVRFQIENERYIEPNQWFAAEVELLYHPIVDYKKLKGGQEFEILEGSHVVGHGTVTSPISERD